MTPLLTRIREKVIASVPEIGNPDSWWQEVEGDVGFVRALIPRPIRLADMLLATQKARNDSIYVRYDGVFFKWENFTAGGSGHHGVKSTFIEWDLHEDDLEKQSPETLEFIGEILGV